MMTDIDELDINPFYRALQTKFLSAYEEAQERCYMICIPKSSCLEGAAISRKLIETHILRPSPFFKGQFTTLKSDSQLLVVDDNARFISTVEGFPVKTNIKIVGEELGYNKEYKPYKMLIVARPFDNNLLQFRPSENGASRIEEMPIKFTLDGCRDFLHKHTDSKLLHDLDQELAKFNKSYVLLKDYLHEASDRLKHLATAFAEKLVRCIKDKKTCSNQLKETVEACVETYVIGRVHGKLYGVICERCGQEDSALVTKCSRLRGLTPAHLSVPKHFSLPMESAVQEMKTLDKLETPIEKLYCLKSSIDKITEEVNTSVHKSQSSTLTVDEIPCLTSDDLIPILVTVLVGAGCRHVFSDLHYMENFYWLAASRDGDSLNYCFVTFKAAVLYLMDTDFSDLDLLASGTGPENSIPKQTSRKTDRPSPSTREPDMQGSVRYRNSEPLKSRLDRQMDDISRMLEQSLASGIQSSDQQQHDIKPISVFGVTSSRSSPSSCDVANQAETKPKDMGDFLASLQDDMFLTSGKQT
ncbi:ankyrin repeat domain-containing protein 27-like [Mya arenaria]|uniref:ankyrin repeat domain-containing protein 27-like n=1 Tax=Mya arenaria TaxID=6604 RepID=UPI0022E1BF08|nr:ankyrin repeat domain-containing protein 27-like [Mya arenaria]